MSAKPLLFIVLVGLVGYTGYTAYEMTSRKKSEALQGQLSSAETRGAVNSVTNIDTYPAHVQAVYNIIPFKLWNLGANKNLTSSEIEAEVKRIRLVIGNKLPHVSNKFVWIVANTPVKADLKANPIVYSFDQGKYMRLSTDSGIANILTEEQVQTLLNSKTDDVVELTKSIVDEADTRYRDELVKRNLIDLAMTLEHAVKPTNDTEKAALLTQLKESIAYQTLIKLDPAFNLDDFILNPKSVLDDAKIDYSNLDLFRTPQAPAGAPAMDGLPGLPPTQ